MKMSKLRISFFTSLTAFAVLMISCGGLNTMLKEAPQVTYKVTPGVLEMHGDSVQITITGQYPPKFFNKKAVMDVTPVLKWEGGEYAFRTEKLQGEQVEANAKIISFETGGNFTYTDKIAYMPEMVQSSLVIRSTASVKDNSIDLPEYKLADGVITTPSLVHDRAETIVATDQFERTKAISQEAQVLYLINQAELRGAELKKDDVKLLKEFIATAKSQKAYEFTGIKISSYASPDGPEEVNEKLAGKRSSAASKFATSEIGKIAGAKASDFVTTEKTAEDWDGFKKMVLASDIADKDIIIRVLEMNSDPIVREKEIKNIAKAYSELKEQVLPKLRRSKFAVTVNIVGKSDSVLLSTGLSADTTSPMDIEEYLKAATLTEDFAKQETILKNATSRYPEEWRAFNNLGVVYMNTDKYDNALEEFKKADELSEGNSMVKNNIGAAYFLKGEKDKAVEYYDLATGAGKQVSNNQAVLKIKSGDYLKAVELYGSSETFNAALAQLLNGDANRALKTLNDVKDVEDPLLYYLKAIIGARSANSDLLMTNLRTAVDKDASLKAKAKTDIEFAKYFEDETFKSIVM